MVGALLTRGMLIGVLAAILSFGFLKVAGEPYVDRAIVFETQMDEMTSQARRHEAAEKGLPAPLEDVEPELVSRTVQAGIGLLTGVAVYNVAFGGLFALGFVLVYGRMGAYAPRAASALLAISGIIAVHIVPTLKYPANPPSVVDPETIGIRTGLYFLMIAISLIAMVAAWMLRNRLVPSFGTWNATLTASSAYLVVVVIAALALPAFNEVPEGFPADVLWHFRTASFGAQIIMWATIGLGFGFLAERVIESNG